MDRIGDLRLRAGIRQAYPDVLGTAALDALTALSQLEPERRDLMAARLARRAERIRTGRPPEFLPPDRRIGSGRVTVADARAGRFTGPEIPRDLERQWIQGTGPAARPRAPLAASLRNVAYALLSGADGWMFDGEDALGQVDTMSLDNHRNLKLAFARSTDFIEAAHGVAREMNAWSATVLGRAIVADVDAQLGFTTRLYRPRGLHLDDRHIGRADGGGFSASIVDAVLYTANNHARLAAEGRSLVFYLPKIQTADEAALWGRILDGLETAFGLPRGATKAYVLVEQVEACFQLMEIRAALGAHFVGFNTGRWDYINSVSDAMAGDAEFVNPNIDAITMTYGYMRVYEDRVRRAVNTADAAGRCALWQGGMEPNIPVGSEAGVKAAMARAVAGAEREREAGASGKWVAHWKMVHIVRPVWERAGQTNQLGRAFSALTYDEKDARDLFLIEPAPRTVRGARDLLSVGLQYGNAFERGFQAAALKPADFFANDDVLYLMEDMATGEIRLSILWEWLHKRARLTEDDPATGVKKGDPFSAELFARLLEEEFAKLQRASGKDVHDDSKATTLPIAREIVKTYVEHPAKAPWYIDLLNLNLNTADLAVARGRIRAYVDAFVRENRRLTAPPDLD